MLDQYKAKEEDFIGLTPHDFFAHDLQNGRNVWRKFFDEGKLHIDTIEKRFNGSSMIVLGDYICIFDDQKRIKDHFGVQRDITDEREAKVSLERYIKIVDEYVLNTQTDLEGKIIYASKAFCNISGFTENDLIGKNHNIIRHPDMPDEIFKDLWQTITSEKNWVGELKNKKKNGEYYWAETYISPLINSLQEKIGYMAVRYDITDKKRIEELSITDRLTGIYNRMRLDEVIHTETERYNRYNEDFSVILFDIDHFKRINDTYGHLVGDKVLIQIAQLVKNNIRKTDTLGRWGGEEFLIIFPHTTLERAAIIAENLRKIIEKHSFPSVERVTASFGISSTYCIKDSSMLIKSVDDALYDAKKNGRNQVRPQWQ